MENQSISIHKKIIVFLKKRIEFESFFFFFFFAFLDQSVSSVKIHLSLRLKAILFDLLRNILKVKTQNQRKHIFLPRSLKIYFLTN